MALNDDFGRTISKSTSKNQDHYRVDDGKGNVFTLSYPTGTDWARAQQVINSLISIEPGETLATKLSKFPNSDAAKSAKEIA